MVPSQAIARTNVSVNKLLPNVDLSSSRSSIIHLAPGANELMDGLVNTMADEALVSSITWARFLSLAQSKFRLFSANHWPGYWSKLPCDWRSTAWAYSEQETENGPWSSTCSQCRVIEYAKINSQSFSSIRMDFDCPCYYLNVDKKNYIFLYFRKIIQ